MADIIHAQGRRGSAESAGGRGRAARRGAELRGLAEGRRRRLLSPQAAAGRGRGRGRGGGKGAAWRLFGAPLEGTAVRAAVARLGRGAAGAGGGPVSHMPAGRAWGRSERGSGGRRLQWRRAPGCGDVSAERARGAPGAHGAGSGGKARGAAAPGAHARERSGG